MMEKAMVVLSGGQDSTTALFWAKQRYKEVHAVTIDYGQRHRIEIEAAKRVAQLAGIEVANHQVINVEGVLRSASPLTSDSKLEKYPDFKTMDKVIGDRVELTFVPMRNMLFFTIAANRAIEKGIRTLVTGICQEDNANYPDCREEFRYTVEQTINRSLGIVDFEIEAPLMFKTKAETVQLAMRLKGCYKALAYTHTSYDGQYPPIDNNHSNVLRAHGFEQAGVPDPLVIRAVEANLMQIPETDNYKQYRLRGVLPNAA